MGFRQRQHRHACSRCSFGSSIQDLLVQHVFSCAESWCLYHSHVKEYRAAAKLRAFAVGLMMCLRNAERYVDFRYVHTTGYRTKTSVCYLADGETNPKVRQAARYDIAQQKPVGSISSQMNPYQAQGWSEPCISPLKDLTPNTCRSHDSDSYKWQLSALAACGFSQDPFPNTIVNSVYCSVGKDFLLKSALKSWRMHVVVPQERPQSLPSTRNYAGRSERKHLDVRGASWAPSLSIMYSKWGQIREWHENVWLKLQ